MTKCNSCHATLKSDEKVCWSCESPVEVKESAKTSFGKKLALVLKFAFFGSSALTVASLFVGQYTPSFMKCAAVTLTLLLAKSSAEQMLERRGD